MTENTTKETKATESPVTRSNKNPIYYRFETLMKANGIMSYGQLSRKTGLARQYLWRIVNGLEEPPTHTKVKIAKYFGVDSRSLWDEEFENRQILKQKSMTARHPLTNTNSKNGSLILTTEVDK